MKALALLLGMVSSLTGAVFELLPGPPVSVFGGGQRSVELILRNRTHTNAEMPIELQLMQASSATVAAWSKPRPWRAIALAPRQTSVERAEIELPKVREESQFLLRVVSRREVLGLLMVRVHPGEILNSLTNTLGQVVVSAVSLELQQTLREAGFTLCDRGQPTGAGVESKLTIFGPDSPAASLAEAMSLARLGMGVVWIRPDDDEKLRTAPSYYPVKVGKGVFVTVREGTIAHLQTDPLAQLRLARIVRLALGHETLNPPESDL